MSKAILISIKPRFVADILKGLKTLEIRKTFPQCELPIDVYIYCTKGQYVGYVSNKYVGKVVAKFTLNDVRQIYVVHFGYYYEYKPVDMTQAHLEERGCVSSVEIDDYLHKKKGYAWCIENLQIFKEPKELSEFAKKPSQSWCYIEV